MTKFKVVMKTKARDELCFLSAGWLSMTCAPTNYLHRNERYIQENFIWTNSRQYCIYQTFFLSKLQLKFRLDLKKFIIQLIKKFIKYRHFAALQQRSDISYWQKMLKLKISEIPATLFGYKKKMKKKIFKKFL